MLNSHAAQHRRDLKEKATKDSLIVALRALLAERSPAPREQAAARGRAGGDARNALCTRMVMGWRGWDAQGRAGRNVDASSLRVGVGSRAGRRRACRQSRPRPRCSPLFDWMVVDRITCREQTSARQYARARRDRRRERRGVAVRRTGRRGSSPGRWAACSSVAEEDGRGQDHPVDLQLVDLVEADGLRGLGRLCTASAPRGHLCRAWPIGSLPSSRLAHCFDSLKPDSLTPKYTFSIWVLRLFLHFESRLDGSRPY